jgi:hypothetical protein
MAKTTGGGIWHFNFGLKICFGMNDSFYAY